MEEIEIEWTSRVPERRQRRRRRWPWEVLPALIVVLLPLTAIEGAAAEECVLPLPWHGSADAAEHWLEGCR